MLEKQRFPIIATECDKAIQEFILQYLKYSDAFVNQIPEYPIYEGNHTQFIQLGELLIGQDEIDPSNKPLEQTSELVEISGQGLIKSGDVREVNINALTKALIDIASGLDEARGKSIFAHLDSSVKDTGMAIDAGGKSFTFEIWLELLEKMDFEFDKQGRPLFPTTVINPAMTQVVNKVLKEAELDEAKMKALKNLEDRKREKFNAKEADRKLVD